MTTPDLPRFVELTTDTPAIGPEGRGTTIPAGQYAVANLDGVPDSVLYLCDRADGRTLLGRIEAAGVDVFHAAAAPTTKETPDGQHYSGLR